MDDIDPERAWRDELRLVVDLMRDVSRQTDPQIAGKMYTEGVRTKLVPSDEWVAVSRRGLDAPRYRITRSTMWKEDINPWLEPHRLPVFDDGLLGELIYSEEPAVIDDLPARVRPDDPAAEYFRGMRMMVTMPQYDGGVALNMGVLLIRDPSTFPRHRIPTMVWQANLYGRLTHALVLRNELKRAYDLLDEEMRSVGDMQRTLLPAALPRVPTLDLAAHYETSRRAGGDYYDLFDLGGGRWGILIADVSGHSTPAAVIMAVTHAVAHLHPGSGAPPAALLGFVNRHLAARYTLGTGAFVTAFYGVYDCGARTLRYARAGHNPPRVRRGGAIEDLSVAGGLPLGIADDEVYDEAEVAFRPGDALLLYTDGITEARAAGSPGAMAAGGELEMFGTDPIDRALAARPPSAARLLDDVLGRWRTFTGGAIPNDDCSLLAAVVR